MSLNVFFEQDIKRILLAAEHAFSTTALQLGGDGDGDAYAQGYRAGHRTMLTTIALAFGLEELLQQPDLWQVVDADVQDLPALSCSDDQHAMDKRKAGGA